jgi:hypothetical protein
MSVLDGLEMPEHRVRGLGPDVELDSVAVWSPDGTGSTTRLETPDSAASASRRLLVRSGRLIRRTCNVMIASVMTVETGHPVMPYPGD